MSILEARLSNFSFTHYVGYKIVFIFSSYFSPAMSMSCCARDSGSKLSKRSRASVWSKQLLRPRSDPIFHILSCLCNWWDFAHEDLLKQSRGNLTTQHDPLGFASFVKHSSFGKQITRAQNPTRLLLVCLCWTYASFRHAWYFQGSLLEIYELMPVDFTTG